jgi:hypothetical protein
MVHYVSYLNWFLEFILVGGPLGLFGWWVKLRLGIFFAARTLGLIPSLLSASVCLPIYPPT